TAKHGAGFAVTPRRCVGVTGVTASRSRRSSSDSKPMARLQPVPVHCVNPDRPATDLGRLGALAVRAWRVDDSRFLEHIQSPREVESFQCLPDTIRGEQILPSLIAQIGPPARPVVNREVPIPLHT